MFRSITQLYVADYYQTKGARDLCHGIKEGDEAATTAIAKRMVVCVSILPPNGILIPIPSHTGCATATLSLVERLSKLSGLPVANIIKGRNREPLYSVKLKSQTVPPNFFGFYSTATITNKIPILIDTVYDTGQTARSAAKLFKNMSPFILTFSGVKKINKTKFF